MLKELRWYDIIIWMDVELIYKPRRDNLVPDVLSRWEKLITLRLVILVKDKFDEVEKNFQDDVPKVMTNNLFFEIHGSKKESTKRPTNEKLEVRERTSLLQPKAVVYDWG